MACGYLVHDYSECTIGDISENNLTVIRADHLECGNLCLNPFPFAFAEHFSFYVKFISLEINLGIVSYYKLDKIDDIGYGSIDRSL